MDRNSAYAFLMALGGDVSYNFRAIHDVRKDIPALPINGTLGQCIEALELYNKQGYGIFVVINETDGKGLETHNVKRIRAHFIDVDGDDDKWSKHQAIAQWFPPTFTVITSPGKFHAYWIMREPYEAGDGERFSAIQRRLIARWHSDASIVDTPRVMRLPGSLHMKRPDNPTMVVMVAGSGETCDPSRLEELLAGVEPITVADHRPLGDPTFRAPSLEWATRALNRIDPGQLAREEWLKVTAAFKAATWEWGELTARFIWDQWCAKYPTNNVGENEKLWRSIRETKTGWNYLSRTSGVAPELAFGGSEPVIPSQPVVTDGEPVQPQLGPLLNPAEQAIWFAGCVLITSQGRILTPLGRFLDTTKFNATYGGKQFILSADGSKTTDEPWKAATRGQVYQIPKVDHIRFLPGDAPGAVIVDELGRKGINTYRPAHVVAVEGDASPFINHVRALLPIADDAEILLSFLRHNVQRIGVKAFWAPVLQSSEGAGKGIILEAMQYALGLPYVYSVNAKELSEGGGKFNAWMRNRLLIIANEIKTDDRRDMLDVLKPMITEARIEIQAKGADQDMEDNCANWLMFTNWKDAIPITRDARRYSIFYSAIQSSDDLVSRNMAGEYFPRLYAWLRGGGHRAVTWYLQHSAIDARYDPAGAAHRAPVTSSTLEALALSLGRVEQTIVMAIEEGRPGFRNGWLSSSAVAKLLKEEKISVGPHIIKRAFDVLGYHFIGRASHQYFMEDMKQPNLYHVDKKRIASHYPNDQGYSA